MAYKVIIQDAALQDMKEYAEWIKDRDGATPATRWMNQLETLIDSLEDMPTRFKTIEEQGEFPIELRQVLHYSHRVVYHVDEGSKTVHVLRLYHGARRALTETDVATP